MTRLIFYVTTLTLLLIETAVAQSTMAVERFDEIIVSPHIQVTLVEGSNESVNIESNKESDEKLTIEVNGKTLRIYLDDAKEITKEETVYENGVKMKRPIYKGTVVTATITYKKLKALSVRGEETLVCESTLVGSEFNLKIYGESRVYLNDVNLKELHTTIYGESELEIKSGSIRYQKVTAYGESQVNVLAVANDESRLTAYGEAEFKINASERIKITSYGEATLEYTGDAKISKGLTIGGLRISKI